MIPRKKICWQWLQRTQSCCFTASIGRGFGLDDDGLGDLRELGCGSPGSAMRMTFLKLKENLGEKEKDEVLGAIGGIKEKFPGIEELSFGENFSLARAKGFSIASIAVFKGTNELDKLDMESEVANLQEDLAASL